MKLRIRGNSIRLRLGESEVARLAKEGRVTESTLFAATPPSALTYVVAAVASATQIGAAFHDGAITISVPGEMARAWAGSAQVSLKGEQKIDAERSLSILIEKDFRCLEPRPDEDESDAFPNPGVQHPACDSD